MLDVLTPLGLGKETRLAEKLVEALPVGQRAALFVKRDLEPYKSGDWVQRVAEARKWLLGRSAADWLLFLDSDIEIAPEVVLSGIEELEGEAKDLVGLGVFKGSAAARDQYVRVHGDRVHCWALLLRGEARSYAEGFLHRAEGECECFAFQSNLEEHGLKLRWMRETVCREVE